MSARRFVAGLAAVLAGVTAVAPTARAEPAAVELSLEPGRASTREGDDFAFRSTIKNVGRTPLSGLVAHLNIASWDPGVYVDPEDWSSERTRYLPPLRPGGSLKVKWSVTAVNGGHFAVYVAVLPRPGAGAQRQPAVSPDLDVHVAGRAGLGSGGLVPLVLGLPSLLGVVAAAVGAGRSRRTARRSVES